MNNIITEKNKKRYLPHDINTRKYAVEMYRNCGDIEYVCRKYHISRVSLWRWNKKYDGTKESITDKSHRPNSKHPNSHTNQEIRWIRNYVRRNPRITLCELWAKLKREKGYTRTMDKRFYQYTYIDEATRERFLYWYEEHTPANTVDFIYRVIKYFGYKPKEIQTDNGTEFTYNKANIKRMHPVEKILRELGIKHHKIQPRTPQHNGKVERSHRNDNERFYSYLKFYSLEDLREQGERYLKRSNNIPMAVLGYLTPKEKRSELEVFGMINYAV